MKDELLTADQLAEELQVPKTTIYSWRYTNSGPRGFRVGKHLRFRRSDVDDWIDGRVNEAA